MLTIKYTAPIKIGYAQDSLFKQNMDAMGVSAKTYDFDANGEQPKMDYNRLIGLVKNSGFSGYIGVEYEGFNQPEDEGIRKTIKLLEKYL